MQQWEYLVFHLGVLYEYRDRENAQDIELPELLNKYGEDGWEIDRLFEKGGGQQGMFGYILILKRPKPEKYNHVQLDLDADDLSVRFANAVIL